MAENITFVINPLSTGEYKTGPDKDGLDKESRKRIEAIKEQQSNPEPSYKEVWDE